MITIRDDRTKRTIHVTMTGFLTLDEVREAVIRVKSATDGYKDGPHLFLADMRGLKPAAPEVAEVLGKAIAYTRQHGVVFCAHLSDSSTVQLQAARLAREAVEGDPAIINVISLEEAERVLEEQRRKLLSLA